MFHVGLLISLKNQHMCFGVQWKSITINPYLFRTLTHVRWSGSLSRLTHMYCASAPALRPQPQNYIAFQSPRPQSLSQSYSGSRRDHSTTRTDVVNSYMLSGKIMTSMKGYLIIINNKNVSQNLLTSSSPVSSHKNTSRNHS